MATESTANILASRMAQFKQKQASLTETVTVFTPNTQPILIKPQVTSWPELRAKLADIVNLPGFLDSRIKQLYDDGFGAELETAAEIAVATAKKSPYNLFAAMVSAKAGNWTTKTLEVVHAAWEARRNALEVVEKLKLKTDSFKQILALAWRLKGTIIRFLGIATEQGTGVKNAVGLFFWLTKKQASTV